ncbi:FixH family protein [Novosphingobium piscinae]|uniref:FixH family protein n=1 Tax=Novosphingobium piscinae TaxID=1507448 RepID=A0A7X1G2C5_9SPHN|nr:FixH family protein [Novosphingobium piscinae]MBC2670712.1 FixH family protein [Novosphingobium piscinae]
MSQSVARPFTGRHMAAIMLAFFGVVIAVNLLMAQLAGRTFGGVVVQNSYVASQHFNRWLDEAGAERGLGWGAEIGHAADGTIRVTLQGVPAGAQVTGEAWHPLGRAPDRVLRFRGTGTAFRSLEAIPAGRWRIRIEVRAGARRWRREQVVA